MILKIVYVLIAIKKQQQTGHNVYIMYDHNIYIYKYVVH